MVAHASSQPLHAILHEPLPESERDWALRLRFSPAVEQAFLLWHVARVARWALLASGFLGLLIALQLVAALLGHPTIVWPLALALVALALVGGLVLGLSIAGALGRIPSSRPLMRALPYVAAAALVCSQALIFQIAGRPLASIPLSLFQVLVLGALALRVRVRQGIAPVVCVALAALWPAWGADAQVLAPLLAQALLAALCGLAIACLLEYEARREFLAQAQIYRVATTDPLSRTLSRRAFFERASYEVERARRYGGPLAVLMVDIDRFKQINDGYGHAAGDQVIAQLGSVCREHLRAIDLVGRIGGEEFAILLPGTDGVSALQVAERLRQRIAASAVSVGARRLSFTVSMGSATLRAGSETLDALLHAADQDLYLAKRYGRNRVGAPAELDEPLQARVLGGATISLTT